MPLAPFVAMLFVTIFGPKLRQRVWDVKTRASDEASPRCIDQIQRGFDGYINGWRPLLFAMHWRRLIRTVDDAPSPTAEKRPLKQRTLMMSPF